MLENCIYILYYLSSSDGEISTRIDIDYETVPEKSCELTVIANDKIANSDPGKYTITITDENEPPVLSKSVYGISTEEVNVSIHQGPEEQRFLKVIQTLNLGVNLSR